MAHFVIIFLLISTAVKNSRAEGLWVANQARYECDVDNDGSTARVVACVPSNNLGGKEYAIGESWKSSEYRYLCVKTYPMQLALQKVACVAPTGEELQPGNSSVIPDKGEYNCVAKGTKDREIFLIYNPGCFYNDRLYAADETLRNGSTVVGCKANGQNGFSMKAIACVSNDKAIPVGDFIQTASKVYSKCQVQTDNVTAVFVTATEKEYNDWMASSGHTTMSVPTTKTTTKTTTTLATVPTRTTTRHPKDCRDKHPLCHDLCTYPCYEDPSPRMGGFYPIVQAVAQAPSYIVNGVSQFLVPQPQPQYYPQYAWPQQAQHVWQPQPQPQPNWNGQWQNQGNQWWQGWAPATTKKPLPTTRPPAGLCHIWTTLGKAGVEQMCPKSCKVIGCKYLYPE